MIPSLIFLLLRRYGQRHPEKAARLRAAAGFAARIGLLLLLTGFLALSTSSQERLLQYTIKRSGSAIGVLTVREIRTGNHLSLKMQSTATTRFLFTIQLQALEEAVFENGALTYSHFYQKVNNSERVNTQMQATAVGYKVSGGAVQELKQGPITYNMVCLYGTEPVQVRQVFADKYHRFVPIEVQGPHHYKITFPDGAANEYFYRNGVCISVALNNTWFSVKMELKN